MAKQYKVCYLACKELTELERRVLESEEFSNLQFRAVSCTVENLPEAVDEARRDGYDIFIAGTANAAEFPRHSDALLSEIVLTETDYLIALKNALRLGKRPGIALYRFADRIDTRRFSQLLDVEVGHITYEDGMELYREIKASDYDVIVGAAHANSLANELGRQAVLLSPGEEAIRHAVEQARQLAISSDKDRLSQLISSAVIKHSAAGMIITDENGCISHINSSAAELLSLAPRQARGKPLGELVPALDDALMSGSRTESVRVINGTRLNCGKYRLSYNDLSYGCLTMLRVDNRSRRKDGAESAAPAAARWTDIPALSPAMRDCVALGKEYAAGDLPVAVCGGGGYEKVLFAECMHSGGPRAGESLLHLNLAAIAPEEAGRILFGAESKGEAQPGLLENAHKGSVILENLASAPRAVQDCLYEVLEKGSFARPATGTTVTVDIKFYTVLEGNGEAPGVREELRLRLGTLGLTYPRLCDRPEDIPEALSRRLSRVFGRGFDFRTYGKAMELAALYRWPGDMTELNVAAERMAFLAGLTPKPGQSKIQHIFIDALGADKLAQSIISGLPQNLETAARSGELEAAADKLKDLLDMNNAQVAKLLGVSRTTLWRMAQAQQDRSRRE